MRAATFCCISRDPAVGTTCWRGMKVLPLAEVPGVCKRGDREKVDVEIAGELEMVEKAGERVRLGE